MTETEPYELRVDGVARKVATSGQGASLATVLRDSLDLPGTKIGCGTGRCGTCAVLLDDVLVASCTVLAADTAGCEVTTVAGLGTASAPGPVQRALVEAGAVQCGYCTPGMVVAITDLLARIPQPTEVEVRFALSGNLCRCTGYGRIIAAVLALAQEYA
jgi:carbon-monoxide dehydrogenase small subunit